MNHNNETKRRAEEEEDENYHFFSLRKIIYKRNVRTLVRLLIVTGA